MGKHIAVYGSLRKGMYNHRPSMGNPVMSFKLRGFRLYSLGAYPAIHPSPNKEDSVVCEVYCVDQRTFNGINAMEIGAGYEPLTITVDGTDCVVYVYRSDPSAYGLTHIVSGDWVGHVNKVEYDKVNE